MRGDWEGLLWAQFWQLAVVIGVVACVARWSVARWPHAAHALWLLVLVKCLTPPVWSSPSGVFSRWTWLRAPWVSSSGAGGELDDAPLERTGVQTEAAGEASASRMNGWPLAVELPRETGAESATALATGVAESKVELAAEGGTLGERSLKRPLEQPLERPIATLSQGLPVSAGRSGAARSDATAGLSTEGVFGANAGVAGGAAWGGWFRRVLGGVWLAGMGGWLGVAAVRWRSCQRRFAQVDEEWTERVGPRVRELAERLGVRRPVNVVVAQAPLGPAVIGIWRPTLVLPSVLVAGLERDWESGLKRLEPIVAHELLHVRRGDLWVGALQTLAQAVWWFHPLVWFAVRRATQTAERCCDEEVVAELGCRPSDYARSLLRVLELKRRLTPIPVFPGVRPVEVTAQRLEAVMRLGQGGRRMARRKASWWTWALFGLGAMAVLPGAGYLTAGSPVAADPLAPGVVPSAIEAAVSDEEPRDVPKPRSRGSEPPSGAELPTVIERLERAAERGRASPDGAKLPAASDSTAADPARRTNAKQTEEQRRESTRSHVYDLSEVLGGRREAGSAMKQEQVRELDELLAKLFAQHPRRARPRWTWQFENNTLVLEGTDEQHNELRKLLAGWHKLDSPMMLCGVSMYEGTASAFESLPLTWTPYVQRRSGEVNRRAETEERPQGGAEPRPTNAPSGNAVTVSRAVLVRITQAPADAWPDMDARLRKHSGVKRQSSPSVAVRPRMRGHVQVGQVRFLEGVERNEEGRLVRRPTEVHEGLQLGIRPIPESSGAWTLHLDAKIDQILRVERHPISGELGDEQPRSAAGELPSPARRLVIEVPEIMTTQVELQLRAPLNKPLLAARIPVPTATQPTREMLFVVRLEEFREAPPRGPEADQVSSANLPASRIVGRGVNSDAGLSGELRRTADSRQLLKVYSVADLVVPVPRVLRADLSGDASELKDVSQATPRKDEADEFRSLIRLIQATIQPESWVDGGGEGRIEANAMTMSLIVRQTAQAHAEIAKLLEDLRQVQDVQVTVDVHLLRAPREALATLQLPWNDDDQKASQTKKRLWPAESLRKVRELCERDQRATLLQMPKVTVFNGQQVELRVDGEPENSATDLMALDILPLVATDHRSVRLSLAFAAVAGAQEMLVASHLGDLRNDQVLLIRPSRVGKRRDQGVPILSNIPFTERLFRNVESPKSELETLLIVYPRIITEAESRVPASSESAAERHDESPDERPTPDESLGKEIGR